MQAEHALEPLTLLNWPPAQSAHVIDPTVLEYWPAEQSSQFA